MGSLTIYTFKKGTNKWQRRDESNINGHLANDNYWYKKYCPGWKIQEGDRFSIPLGLFQDYRKEMLTNKSVTWFEKILFRLNFDGNYFTGKLKKLVMNALEFMETANPTSHPLILSYNDGLWKFLNDLELGDDEAVSFGYSSGGFWGTDAEKVLSSIQIKLSSSVVEKISDNVHLNPFHWGTDIFEDYSDREIKEILERV